MGRLFDGLLTAGAVLAAGLISAIVLAISANVGLKAAGLSPLYGTLDAVEYALMLATFAGAPWVLWQGGHVQVDLLTAALPPHLARPLARGVALLGAVICLGFAWFGFQAMATSLARGAMIRTAFVIPEWWTLAVAPVALALCALELLRQAARPTARPAQSVGL